VLSKRKLINLLFLIALPVYGIGCWLIVKKSPTIGYVTASLGYLSIILFWLVDRMYQRVMRPMTNRVFWIGMAYIISLVLMYWLSLLVYRVPILSLPNTVGQSLLTFVPLPAVVIVMIYNRNAEDFDFTELFLRSLLALLILNYLGYAAGMRNLMHSFEGRVSLPFATGIYDGSHLVALVNMLLLFRIKATDLSQRPLRFFFFSGIYVVNLAAMVSINSRLSFMVFLVFTVLFLFKVMKAARVYVLSLFTMPIMMSFALLIYSVVSLPFFANILGRVSKEDVTTFNGRTYIWEAVWDWVVDDRRGMLQGLGYHGHFKIGMLDEVARLWGEEDAYNLHMHSTFLEILTSQGIIVLGIFYWLMWVTYKYYRQRYIGGFSEAPLYAAMIYILFVYQIDIFAHGIFLGHMVFFTLLAYLAVDKRFVTRPDRLLNGELIDRPDA
jgi:O-antigen ligase